MIKPRTIVIFCVLALLTELLYCCKKEQQERYYTEIPAELISGDTIFQIMNDTVIRLHAIPLKQGLSGRWSVGNYDAGTGVFDSIYSPTTIFRGELLGNYTLIWEVTNGRDFALKTVTVKFLIPELLKDTLLSTMDTFVNLNASPLQKNLTGSWNVISDNANTGTFKNYSASVTAFSGLPGETYNLRWLVASKAGSKYQDIVVKFTGFIDKRDNERYKAVKIGYQVWMAENLRFNNSANIRYYNDNVNYKNTYGCLYTWDDAQTSVPAGWHLPSYYEWWQLLTYLTSNGYYGMEGKVLKSTTGWDNNGTISGNGTDLFGFNALPGGIGNTNISTSVTTFSLLNDEARFWTSSEEGSDDNPLFVRMIYNSDSIRNFWYTPNAGLIFRKSVRCIRN